MIVKPHSLPATPPTPAAMSSMPYVVCFLILAAGYFVTGWFGLQIPYLGVNITLIWLPTGVAVGLLLRWGYRYWPAISVASVLVNLTTGVSMVTAVGIMIGNTLAPLCAVWLMRRWRMNAGLLHPRDIGLFLLATVLGMLVSSTSGVLILLINAILPQAAALNAWVSWWMGDVIGVLIAAPLLFTWNKANRTYLTAHPIEFLLCCLLIVGAGVLAFVLNPWTGQGPPQPLAYVAAPLVAWAVFRFSKTGGAVAVMLLSILAAVGTALGKGPFVRPNPNEGMLLLWGYITSLVVLDLLIYTFLSQRQQIENALVETESQFRKLFETSKAAMLVVDPASGRIVDANPAAEAFYGFPPGMLVTLSLSDINALSPEIVRDQLEKVLGGGADTFVFPHRLASGAIRTVEERVSRFFQQGHPLLFSIIQDITARSEAEAELRIAATAFEAQEGMMVMDAQGLIVRVNQSFQQLTGYAAEEVIGMAWTTLHAEQQDPDFYRKMWHTLNSTHAWQGEVWSQRQNGEKYLQWLSLTEVRDDLGILTHYVGAFYDITQRKVAEEQIRQLAFYDPLTQLPNRRLMFERISQAMVNSDRSGMHCAIMFIDLDDFKILNDTLGHDLGDQLLIEVARRLQECVRKGDSVARLGGDEFLVLLEGLSEESDAAAAQAEMVAGKIWLSLNEPCNLAGHEIHTSPSVGVCLFQGQLQTVEEVLKHADVAMYKAKAAGRNAVRFFDPSMQQVLDNRARMENDLREAISASQLQLYIQPQFNDRYEMIGAECLIRWSHPERGLVSPGEFIPLAEETGQIVGIGYWILEAAARFQSRIFARVGLEIVPLAVNVSARQVLEPEFVENTRRMLTRLGCPPQFLKLEITESVIQGNVQEASHRLNQLKEMGFLISMDDFGTGYSSLTYLKNLPFDQIKIDQSFVRELEHNASDQAIVQTIVVMSRSLGLDVIAEGVETLAQMEKLRLLGCNAYQGYFFHRPVPEAEFEAHFWPVSPESIEP